VLVLGKIIAVGVVNKVVAVIFGDVDPEVRLKMTLPAATPKGSKLLYVLILQVLLFENPGPQQNKVSCMGNIVTLLLMFTAIHS